MKLEAIVKEMCRLKGLDVPDELVRMALGEARRIYDADSRQTAGIQTKDAAHAYASGLLDTDGFRNAGRQLVGGLSSGGRSPTAIA